MKDDQLLEHYVRIAEVVGRMFEPILEVVVNDLRQPETSIVAIQNGHVTERKVGDAASDLGQSRLVDSSIPDLLVNYENTGPRGQKLKSSSVAIRNEAGELLGSIGFNLDLSYLSQFGQLLSRLISCDDLGPEPISENFHVLSARDEIHASIESFLLEKSWQAHCLSSADKKEVIEFLFREGHLNKRNAVTVIAEKLQLTRPSVYNYLKEIKELSA